MRFGLTFITSLLAIGAAASPLAAPASDSSAALVTRENDKITYLGSQGGTLSGGTKFGNLVFVSGQVPLLNGTVVPGGVANEVSQLYRSSSIDSRLERSSAPWETAGPLRKPD